MRFLCLHGSGTSAEILRYQLSALRQYLQSRHHLEEHTFDFLDGPYTSPAGPGVGSFFSPPYYVWWEDTSISTSSVRTAAEALLTRLATSKKSYDAVIGFSQGTALLAATTLLCQAESRPLPWRGAICLSGGLPLTFLENYIPVSQAAKDQVDQSYIALNRSSSRMEVKIAEMIKTGERVEMWDTPTPLWDGKEQMTRDPWTLPPQAKDLKNVFHLDLSDVPNAIQIQIPIAVVYGHKDPMCAYHVQLAMLCDEKKRLVYDHRGGHEIPRVPGVVKDLASIVEWLDEQIM